MRTFLLTLAFLTACASGSHRYGRVNVVPDSVSSPVWASGTGTPEGVVTAPIGSIYSRADGAVGTTLYRKESGTGNTGWIAGVTFDAFKAIVGTPVANHGSLGAGSKNTIGSVTTIGANTSVTLTYSSAYPTGAYCQATLASATTQEYVTVTSTASVATFTCLNSSTNAAANCDDFTYLCFGY